MKKCDAYYHLQAEKDRIQVHVFYYNGLFSDSCVCLGAVASTSQTIRAKDAGKK